MDIKEIRRLKERFEDETFIAVSKRTVAFEEETGVRIEDITVEIVRDDTGNVDGHTMARISVNLEEI